MKLYWNLRTKLSDPREYFYQADGCPLIITEYQCYGSTSYTVRDLETGASWGAGNSLKSAKAKARRIFNELKGGN